jgi:hypothetical protein
VKSTHPLGDTTYHFVKANVLNAVQDEEIGVLKARIKRLEKACGEMVSEEDTYIRLQTWLKAKEAKP